MAVTTMVNDFMGHAIPGVVYTNLSPAGLEKRGQTKGNYGYQLTNGFFQDRRGKRRRQRICNSG